MTNIIFDFDGVIHNTFDFHFENINKTYPELQMTEQEYRDAHNGNFHQEPLDKFKNIDWSKYRNSIYEEQGNLKVDKSMFGLIEKLSKRNTLFLLTSGYEIQVKEYMKNNNLLQFFKRCICAGEFPNKHTAIEELKLHHEGDFLFVTDTLGDIREANEADIRTVAVSSGFHSRETLERGSPWRVVDSIDELSVTLGSLL